MYIKIHKSYRNVVSLCDENLINKRFEEGNRQLDLKEGFYKDKLINKEEAIKILQHQTREDATFNIVGEKSIQTAIEAKIISETHIDKINNIPFILILI